MTKTSLCGAWLYTDLHITGKAYPIPSVKFLGLLIDGTLNWDKHIKQIASKLSTASYAVRTLTPLLSLNALEMLYFSYAHSIISYGIIFWGASTNTIKIFRRPKKKN